MLRMRRRRRGEEQRVLFLQMETDKAVENPLDHLDLLGLRFQDMDGRLTSEQLYHRSIISWAGGVSSHSKRR